MPPRLHQHTWMDSDIETFREQVRRYVAAEFTPCLDGWRRQGYIPRETWRLFGKMGFLLPEMDEAYGGAGANLAWHRQLNGWRSRRNRKAGLGVSGIMQPLP